jgi:hypothetical protein
MLNVTKDDFPLLTNVNENYLQVSAPGRFGVLKKMSGRRVGERVAFPGIYPRLLVEGWRSRDRRSIINRQKKCLKLKLIMPLRCFSAGGENLFF